MGALGAVWRDYGASSALRTLAPVAPAAALAGEVIVLAGEWRGRAAVALPAAELALAAALLPACAWRAPLVASVLAAAVLSAAFAISEDELRDAMRTVGWRGA